MLNSTLEVRAPLGQRHLLEELYREQELRSYADGASIAMTSEDIWVVYRGVVQLSTLHCNGDEVLLGLAGPSMPFGLPLSSLESYFATALSKVELLRLSLADIEASDALSQRVFRQLGRRLRQTEVMLALVGHRRVEVRLRHLLCLLQEEVGQPVSGGTRIAVKLTHQQLANAIGTTRVTVTRLLRKLRDEHWVTLDQSRHIVLTTNFSLFKAS